MNIVRDVGANSVWRMASPSTVSEDEIDLARTIMDDSLTAVDQGAGGGSRANQGLEEYQR
jgi:hypothetical protein